MAGPEDQSPVDREWSPPRDIEEYLGDGVYCTFDGYHFWLDCRAQPELSPAPSGSPGIALEPPVIDALNRFRKRVREQLATR